MASAPAEYEETSAVASAVPQEDQAPAFFSMENLRVAQVQLIGGLMNGYSVGFVGVYAYLYLVSTDCSKYTSDEACGTVANAECEWDTGRQACGWREFTCEWTYTTEDACLADSRCNWVYGDKKCMNPIGFSSVDSGIFAGAMILGCMIGSLYSGPFASKVGYRISFLIVGIAGVVSSVMYHVAAATNEFWVLCVGRLLVGLVLGLVCVACPMYVDQNIHPKHSKVVGVLFQVFGTFANMFSSTIGLALGQSIKYDRNAHMIWRMEGFCVFTTLFAVLMVFLGIFIGEGKTKFVSKGSEKKEEDGRIDLDPNEYSYMQMIGPLTMGVVMAGTLQLTGINAVMNYAPGIMGSLGMEPLVGNFVVMTWNFVTTLLSIPLARYFTMRQLFLAGSIMAALACLLLCGIPVYPGVTNENTKNGVAITGIAVFIAAFEFGVGPCFFVLAQDMFPPSFRPKGASFTIMAQFLFNVIINVCYPIATEAISGGKSGDQDKGQAVAFIFFGAMGLVCFVLQVLFLFPWEDKISAHEEHLTPAETHSTVQVETPNSRN